VVSRPDALINKARIAIEISLFGRQSALFRTRVQLIWKLPIRLQPSGRLPLMVRTHAKHIWKLRVEELPSGRSSPLVRTREALYGNYLQRTCDRSDVDLKQKRFSSKFSENPVTQLSVQTALVHRSDGVYTYYNSRPFCTSAYK
jgi:hypothetical protein